MCFLKFILLLLIPSHIRGGCQPSISVTAGQNVCSGQNFTLTCQFDCHGPSNHAKLVKEEQIKRSLESSNNSFNLSIDIHGANKNHSGKYSCQTETPGSISMVYVTVKDCGFSSTYIPEYLPSVHTTSSSLTNTTHQDSTPSGLLKPVLIWYMLFKTGIFLIGSITAALITVCQKH